MAQPTPHRRLQAVAALAGGLLGGCSAESNAPRPLEQATAPTLRFEVERLPDGSGGYGWALAAPGDVTGDGLPDLLVGAPGEGAHNEGAVYLVAGEEGGLSSPPVLIFTGAEDTRRGVQLLAPGDVNGDGHADLLARDEVPSRNPDTHLYLGTGDPSAPFPASPDHTFADLLDAFSPQGRELQAAGDLNGDGYDDVVACALGADTLHILWGGPSVGGTVESVPLSDFGIAGGCRVGAGGDITGDGYPDLALGDDETSRVGVFPGGPSGVAREASGWTEAVTSWDSRFSFPRHLAVVGNINGDGLADIAAVCLYFSDDWYDVGYTMLYAGSADPDLGPHMAKTSMAQHVLAAGNLDGRGPDEVVLLHEALSLEFAIYVQVVWGDPDMEEFPDTERLQEDGRDLYGHTGVLLGDLDGDGIDELVVSKLSGAGIYLIRSIVSSTPGDDTATPTDSGTSPDSGTPDTVDSGETSGEPTPEDDPEESVLDTASPGASPDGGAKAGGCSRAGLAPLGLWWGLLGGVLGWRRLRMPS
jgi:hypothetical protein